MLRAQGLRKEYGGVVAVESFDVELQEGAVLGLLGPKGAGKTTVLRMLSGDLCPDAGAFEVAGVNGHRSREVRRRVGVLPENPGYPLAQTGRQWLSSHGQLYGLKAKECATYADVLLAEVGLAEQGGGLVAGYSRGMRHRLGLARTLMNEPRVLLLDEPTLGLDPVEQLELRQLVLRLALTHAVTVVLTTQSLEEVDQVCDQALVLHRGRVVVAGPVVEVVGRVSAPRHAFVRVRRGDGDRALALLTDLGWHAERRGEGADSQLEVTLDVAHGLEAGVAQVLRQLLDAQVGVLGLRLEGGRLSEAFLSLVEQGR